MALASEPKLYFWIGPALCTQGWATVQNGDVEEGIAKIRQGLNIYETVRINATYDYRRSGLDRFHEAELHRLEGELLRRRGDEAGAAAAFRAALELAQRQSARSYALRAAMSHARLLRDQGRRDAARELLTPVHGWFTEGYDTHDLRAAATLLGEVG